VDNSVKTIQIPAPKGKITNQSQKIEPMVNASEKCALKKWKKEIVISGLCPMIKTPDGR